MTLIETILGPNKLTRAVWKKQAQTRARTHLAQVMSGDLHRFSLTCRHCSRLALPLYNTANRYRCPGCTRQFAAAQHNLGFKGFGGRVTTWNAIFEAYKEVAGRHARSLSDQFSDEDHQTLLWKSYLDASEKFAKTQTNR